MATLPPPIHSLVASIYRWREEQEDHRQRPHLGASQIGHPCARHLWLGFRWAAPAAWDGRMLRLFDRGQREEAVFVAELRGIGAEVLDTDPQGQQWRVTCCGGHAGGSLDGCVRNLPGGSAINYEICEFKTHNAKSFKDVAAKGVQASKPMHYAQMQLYLHLTGMTRANYLAVNKDTDALYYERVKAESASGQALEARAASIVFAPEPPPKISNDPSWFQCYGCQHHGLCHGTSAPLVTCRTCAHATPAPDGQWLCEWHHGPLADTHQRSGCEAHRFIPVLLERFAILTQANAEENWAEYRLADGEVMRNGQPGLSSWDIAGRFAA